MGFKFLIFYNFSQKTVSLSCFSKVRLTKSAIFIKACVVSAAVEFLT